MTGTASSKGKLFYDFDSYKNDEWLKRRKCRIEQVRKQSKEIAKALRQKVENEEKLKTRVFEKIEEAKFKCWRAEKLDEMERKLRCALEEFGMGHKLAEAEPFQEELVLAKNKINSLKAQERGEVAKQEAIRRKQYEKKKKLSPIHRKKFTRKVEDLRSALVRSVLIQKHLFQPEDDNVATNEPEPESHLHISNTNIETAKDQITSDQSKKKLSKNSFLMDEPVKEQTSLPDNSVMENNNAVQQENDKPCHYQMLKNDIVWINLNDIQEISDKKSSESRITSTESTNRDQIRPVEFYDYYSRYNCKTYREYENLVEKIDCNSEHFHEPIGEAEKACDIEKMQSEKKKKAQLACEERGNEAFRKEKIKRDYHEMIAKLDDLNKKERLIKTYQFSSKAAMHMSDERILERAKAKQRILSSKFESIYYNAKSEISNNLVPDTLFEIEETTENPSSNDGDSVKPSFSPSNPKPNTPVVWTEKPLSLGIKNFHTQPAAPIQKKKKKLKRKLLQDIDRALLEGRKLRETIMQNRGENNGEGDNCLELCPDNELTPESSSKTSFNSGDDGRKKKIKDVMNREVQTNEIEDSNYYPVKDAPNNIELVDFAVQVSDDALFSNISTSTVYKSPPSELSCNSSQPFLNHLENIDDSEDYLHLKDNPQLRRKIEKMLKDLISEMKSPRVRGKRFEKEEYTSSAELKYYIKKLLNMSRECVANLSVSSDNSTIKGPDKAIPKEYDSEIEQMPLSKTPSKVDCRERICETHREEFIKDWKSLLGRDSTEGKSSMLQKEKLPCDSLLQNFSKITEEEKFIKDNGYTDYISRANKELTIVEEESEKEEDKSHEEDERKEITVIKLNSEAQKDLDLVTKKCTKRISELTELLNQVRRDKEILLETASESSFSSLGEKFKVPEVYKIDEPETVEMNSVNKALSNSKNKCLAVERFNPRGNLPQRFQESKLTNAMANNRSNAETSFSSTETFPDVMNELLERKIISSPFKWSEGNFSKELDITSENQAKPSSIETVIGDFRQKISKIKPFSLSSSGAGIQNIYEVDVKNKSWCIGIEDSISISSEPKTITTLPAETSFDSMDKAFKNLGLNWAKSFLRKIEETKAMSSSSGSDDNKSKK